MNVDKEIEIFNQLLSKQKITIHIGLDWIEERDKKSFTSPLLRKSNLDSRKLLKFLKNSSELEVSITNKKPLNWRVYYSGTIKNEHGDVLTFENVDNGFCVNIG